MIPAVLKLFRVKPFYHHRLIVPLVIHKIDHPSPWTDYTRPTRKLSALRLPLSWFSTFSAVADHGVKSICPARLDDRHAVNGPFEILASGNVVIAEWQKQDLGAFEVKGAKHFIEGRIPANGDPDPGFANIECLD